MLFHRARHREDGSEDPDFRPQQAAVPRRRHSGNGPNFGAGSSRESAVWSMLANDIRVVVAKSFCRYLPRELPAERRVPGDARPATCRCLHRPRGRRQWSRAVYGRLVTQRISGPGGPDIAFEISAADRTRLLEGLDDIGIDAQAHGRDRRLGTPRRNRAAVAAGDTGQPVNRSGVKREAA